MTQANTQIPGFGLLGHPLGHSMSPFIHQALFALSGRPQPYALHDVAPEDLKTQVPKLLAGQGFNITIPYKVEIIPFLTQLSEKAGLYQSVNTVEIKDGRYIGHNTDVDGFLHGIRSLGVELSQGPVLMLGSGGVANMIATEVVLAGSPLTIAVRKEDVQQAAALKERLLKIKPEAEITTCLLDEPNGSYRLLVNATPVGMYPNTQSCPVTPDIIRQAEAVFDLVYNPFETQLVQTAKSLGLPAGGGLSMLVWQAAVAHEIWFGDSFTDQQIQQVILQAKEYMEAHFQA
ncbi:MAG TPA: shikimate dehydrogenase [Candidatus Egerieicola faecale]|uniref:Shikimate dehydrogenase (NADP(+)) n=1 Tax=Candidatus Egerieicola faecale TaxID=2840774 RepID=A0A9D1IQI1_9FIRM|nr:shikimate dehydrogenase [Candidatus Egerieicola faecale]